MIMTAPPPLGPAQPAWAPPDGLFPILPWSPLHGWERPYEQRRHGLESIAACNFTVAGFIHAEDVPACERLGLKAIMSPPRRPRYMGEEWASLSDAALDLRVREMTAGTAASEAVLGYFVMDEPGATMFPTLRRVVQALRYHAPGKLAYINLYPNYATIGAPDQSQLQVTSYTEYLERYVAEVHPQFLSYDNYMVLYSDDLRDPVRAARYYTNLLETRGVALEHDLPWWQIVSSNQVRPHTPIPSPANLLFQAYTTLAAGGTGVGWFTYYGVNQRYAPIDRTGLKTETWSALQMVNHHLRAIGPLMHTLRSTGVYASQRIPQDPLPRLPGKLVTAVESPEPIMVGEFLHLSGVPHVMLVNLSLERSTKCTLDLSAGHQVIAAASVDDGQFHPVEPDMGIWLFPGQGTLLRLAPRSEAGTPDR
jgi:hypothetical protein